MKQLFNFDIHIGDWRILVQSNDIQNGAIQSRHIAPGAVTAEKIEDGTIPYDKIQDGAITSQKIQDGAITTEKIKNGAVTTDKIQDGSITGDTMPPGSLPNGKLGNESVSERCMQNNSVSRRTIQTGAVSTDKLAPNVPGAIVLPLLNPVDRKYENITTELYQMIRSLQIGGVALSGQFGNREDIGITQKKLTEAIGCIWDKLAEITGETYIDFTLTVIPAVTYSETTATITITADCSDAISDFDSIRIYVDNVLVGESSSVTEYSVTQTISQTSVVKAVAVVLGRTMTKEITAVKDIPFFIGSGTDYTDVMNAECLQELDGTLEGSYDAVVKNNGDYLYIIIPISRKDEFRRADMNGYEIPMISTETADYVVYQSLNTYQEGTYNIDIDINS